ncbi:CHAT domain-containing protein [Streptomyces sp. HUAS ZL42]|uniref:CHAT domain-containing WD40 repeat protein n=1 Tax=Streptomyces sp. HUAS ZL42 TaxID=3231715 RepID=UPI00345F00C7
MSESSDFVLEIRGQGAQKYVVSVSSPAGEDSDSVALDAEYINSRLRDLQTAVLASSAIPRAVALGLERPVREVGEHLFRTVLGNRLRGLFLSSRQLAEANGRSLRVVLRIREPELASLPWELLHCPDFGGYLSMREPVVRYVDMPEPVRPMRAQPPLRILGMTSLPGTLARLDADAERAGLEVALRPLIDQRQVQLDWVDGQTVDDLSRRLLHGCHILHFIGHGSYDPERQEGMIALADADGRAQLLHASAFAALISVARPRPQLVMLNSCQSGTGNSHDLFSSTAAVLVRTVPAVVAMQFAVTDKAATRFSASFYDALAAGRSVDEAVRVGRVALVAGKDDSLEWATPVLYLRGGDARLFDLSAPARAGGDAARREGEPADPRSAWTAQPGVPVQGESERSDVRVPPMPEQRPSPPEHPPSVPEQRWFAPGRQPPGPDPRPYTPEPRPSAPQHVPFADGRLPFPPGYDSTGRGLHNVPGTGQPAMTARVLNTGQWVHALSFHPDGRRLAAGSRKWVRVWDAQTGNRVWEQSVAWLATVFAVAFSPDGHRLATGSADNTLRVWSAVNGEEMLTLRHDHIVFGLAFSPDGHRLASASGDRTVRLWDPGSGEQMLRIPHDQMVTDVAVSPDGQFLASASADRSVRVWSGGGALVLRLRHDHTPKALAFGPDGTRLATCDDAGTARIWDVRHGHQLLLVRHGGALKDVAFSPDGRWIATAGTDRTAVLWDSVDGARALRVQHDHYVFAVAFSPDGRWLASGSEDKTIKLTPVPPPAPGP